MSSHLFYDKKLKIITKPRKEETKKFNKQIDGKSQKVVEMFIQFS